MFPLHDLLETQLSLAQWTRVTACLPTSSPRGKGHSPSAIGSRGFSDRSVHSPGASADTDRGSGLGQGCKVLSPCPARCSRLRLREHLPWLCMKKKTFRQNNYFNLVLLCFKTNPLRSDSGVLKYYSHWDLAPIEFGRYSLTTRVLIEALENTSGQFHYLMALGFPNAS